MNIVGIDPGVRGAVAWMEVRDGSCSDIRVVCLSGLRLNQEQRVFADNFSPADRCALEKIPYYLPGKPNHAKNSMKLAESFGRMKAHCAWVGLEPACPSPPTWKGHFEIMLARGASDHEKKKVGKEKAIEELEKRGMGCSNKITLENGDAVLLCLWALDNLI